MFTVSLISIIQWMFILGAIYSLAKYVSNYVCKRLIHHNHVIDNTKGLSKLMYDVRFLNDQATSTDKKFVKEANKLTKYPKSNIHLIQEVTEALVTIITGTISYVSWPFVHSIWLVSLAWDLYVIYVIWSQYDYNQKNEKNKNRIIPKINQCFNSIVSKLKKSINN